MDVFHVYDRYIFHDEMDFYECYPPAQCLRLTGNAFFTGIARQGFAFNDLVSKVNATMMLGMADLRILQDFGSNVPQSRVHLYTTALMRTESVFMARVYAIIDGALIATLDGLALMVSIADRKVMKPADVARRLGLEISQSALPAPQRIVLPSEMQFVRQFPIYYFYCDLNKHMTYSRYADIVCEAIGYWDKGRHIHMKHMQMEYAAEALSGDVLNVYVAETEGGIYVKGMKEDGRVSFKAFVELLE